ncbi:MAG TPA: ECF transporter S component [Clostridia bacterium]|nr:ECF transporter S component [Clostridia bacterium]
MIDIWQVLPDTLEKFKPFGMTAKGAGAAYAIALVYIALMVVLGIWWNRHLPSSVAEEGWSSRTIARIAILTALSAAGGFITLPGATSIRFDSLAGYFGTLMFGWQVGAIVAMFGTFFSNLMSGFSGWAPLVPYYMINMALAVTCFGIATKKFGKVPGIIVGTIANTLCIAPWPLMMGWAMLIATIIQQVLGSYANCLLAALAYSAITAAQTRRRYEEPVDPEEQRIVEAMIAQAAKSKPGAIAEPPRVRRSGKGALLILVGISLVLIQAMLLAYKFFHSKKAPVFAFATAADLMNMLKLYWVSLLGVILFVWGLVRRIIDAANRKRPVKMEA